MSIMAIRPTRLTLGFLFGAGDRAGERIDSVCSSTASLRGRDMLPTQRRCGKLLNVPISLALGWRAGCSRRRSRPTGCRQGPLLVSQR